MSDLKFVIVDVFMYWFLQIQQQELEAVRQREANLTALAAIGPRKKRRTDDGASVSALGFSIFALQSCISIFSIVIDPFLDLRPICC